MARTWVALVGLMAIDMAGSFRDAESYHREQNKNKLSLDHIPKLGSSHNWLVAVPQNARSSGSITTEKASAAIEGSRLLLRCKGTGVQTYNDIFINLDDLTQDHPEGQYVVPVDTWRIWASEADMLNPRANPIFEAKPG